MKKTYNTPSIKVAEMNFSSLLTTMSSDSSVGISYQGDTQSKDIDEADAKSNNTLWD